MTASERTFAHLWALSGARRLVGYEAMLLAALARTDLPLYEQLTAVDLDDPDATLDAVEAIQRWRRAVATGTRSFAFGPRSPQQADVRATDLCSEATSESRRSTALEWLPARVVSSRWGRPEHGADLAATPNTTRVGSQPGLLATVES